MVIVDVALAADMGKKMRNVGKLGVLRTNRADQGDTTVGTRRGTLMLSVVRML